MNRMGRNEIYFNRQIPIDEVLDNIDKVREADVSYMAGRLFKKGKIAFSIIGPEDGDKKLARSLELVP
jgi:predicted Zn-dependent peptidase